MYLGTVTCTVNHPSALALGPKFSAHAEAANGVPVSAWASFLSPQANEITWGAMLPTLAAHQDALQRLGADEGYREMIAAALPQISNRRDALYRVIANTVEPGEHSFVSMIQGEAAPGRLVDAYAAAVEITDRVTSLAGIGGMALQSVTGTYSGFTWIFPVASLADMDRWYAALAEHPEFVQRQDEIGTTFRPGTTSSLWRRLA